LPTICRWSLEIIPPFFKAHNSNTHLSSMNLSIMPNNIKTLNTNCDVNLKKKLSPCFSFLLHSLLQMPFYYKNDLQWEKLKKKKWQDNKSVCHAPMNQTTKIKNKKFHKPRYPATQAPFTPPDPPPKKRNRATGVHVGSPHWLPGSSRYFILCPSPFLVEANGKGQNCGDIGSKAWYTPKSQS
jgi:hypothetical protein